MNNEIKPILRSSQDPNQVSLTIASAGKVLIGIITSVLAMKGVESAEISNQLEVMLNVVVVCTPAAYTLYHGMQTIVGISRKFALKKNG